MRAALGWSKAVSVENVSMESVDARPSGVATELPAWRHPLSDLVPDWSRVGGGIASEGTQRPMPEEGL